MYSADATTLVGDWTATGVNNGSGGVETNAQTEALTATFAEDGSLSGSGGCNTFNAGYTVEGADGLTIGPIASTKMACPDEVMTAEDALLHRALERRDLFGVGRHPHAARRRRRHPGHLHGWLTRLSITDRKSIGDR